MTATFKVGARARVRRDLAAAAPHLQQDGTVVRVDPRGVLVKLDSGFEILCEPSKLVMASDNG